MNTLIKKTNKVNANTPAGPFRPRARSFGLERADKDPRYEKVTHFALEFFFWPGAGNELKVLYLF